jgi:hypothetical protein
MKTAVYFAIGVLAATVSAGEARAWTVSPAGISQPAASAIAVSEFRHRHGSRSGRSLFSNWCAYNCYSVPPCSHGRCFGRYGYSRFAYDEDLPFPYRYDRDASPIDNGDAFLYRYTGQPIMRAFERIY